VDAFLARGCRVVFGDIDETAGNAKVDELTTRDKSVGSQLKFVPTDITNYDHVYRLFQVAYEAFGRVDIAANIAGLTEIAGWFDPPETLESVKRVKQTLSELLDEIVDCVNQQKPTTMLVDVNLNGTLYFSRIACVFLRQGQQRSDDKSLILISSVAGFKEYPGLFVYQVCLPFPSSLRPWADRREDHKACSDGSDAKSPVF